MWQAHGSHSEAVRKIWMVDTDADGTPDATELSWPNIFSSGDVMRLNDDMPSIVFGMSCEEGWPEDTGNLGRSLLCHGAIATVMASRDVWTYFETWHPDNDTADWTVGYKLF